MIDHRRPYERIPHGLAPELREPVSTGQQAAGRESGADEGGQGDAEEDGAVGKQGG